MSSKILKDTGYLCCGNAKSETEMSKGSYVAYVTSAFTTPDATCPHSLGTLYSIL